MKKRNGFDFWPFNTKAKKKERKEWIDQQLAEVEKLPAEAEISPAEEKNEETYIHYSIDVNSAISDYNEWDKTHAKDDSFQKRLLRLLDESELSNSTFYENALMDRKLFSAIKNNPDYHPKKETAVACCFGLNLDLKAAGELLDLAGYKLSLSIKWDRIVYYCLKNGIHDLYDVNDLLYAAGEKCIRQ